MDEVWCVFNVWILVEDEEEIPHKDFLAVCRDKETALKQALEYAEKSRMDEDEEITPFEDRYKLPCSNPNNYDLFVIERVELH